MPVYDYRCAANGRTVEVAHDSSMTVRNWGELCFLAQVQPGKTDPGAPVERVFLSAPAISVTKSNSEIKAMGFTKLVKRDDGVYENVTAMNGESRYMVRGKKETLPHIHKKVDD